MIDPASEQMSYQDELIWISLHIAESGIGFEIQNKSSTGIKINWEELAYINTDGTSMRVVNKNTSIAVRPAPTWTAPQAPTMIAPGTRHSNFVIPSDHIRWVRTAGNDGYIGRGELFPSHNKSAYVGRTFGLFFPLEINRQHKEYTFMFKVDRVECVKK
jgi:hypothetical protein